MWETRFTSHSLNKSKIFPLHQFKFFQSNLNSLTLPKHGDKAHGHDMISIRMIRICDASVCKPLELIFRLCFETGKFSGAPK